MKKELPVIGTPNNVDVLLYCHCTPEPHPRASAPAVKETLDWFLEIGVIERDMESEENIFRTTDLGRAWVTAICSTSIPRKVFLDGNGEII